MNNPTTAIGYESPNRKAWRRFLRNRAAIWGLLVILAACLIALFGHFIAPDHSPDADERLYEIGKAAPGYQIKVLQIKKSHETLAVPCGIWQQFVVGCADADKLLPINDYSLLGNTLVVEKYMGQGRMAQTDSLSAVSVVWGAVDSCVWVSKDGVGFNTSAGDWQWVSNKELQQNIAARISQKRYWLGTDKEGRDNLSRLMLGTRISLSVGFMAVLISLLLGVFLGAVAGYFRGTVDNIISAIINLFWSIPLLLLVFALMMVLERAFWQVYLAIGLTMWVGTARLVRGQVLSLREHDFVSAASGLGASHSRIIVRHILPNLLGPVLVLAAADFANAIIIEAGLTFLGIGVQPPAPSWGAMLHEYYSYIGTNKAFLALIPGSAICLLVLAFNMVGNGLRDALDVRG